MPSQELSEWIRERYAEAGRMPEFEHLTRVAGLAKSHADRAVAWLHDIVEDDLATLADVRSAIVKTTPFAEDEVDAIVASVDILMRRKSSNESYPDYIGRVIETGDQRALRVKQLDLLDHLDPYHRYELRPDQASRYLAALGAIINSTMSKRD
jgi:hypothetical protein